MSSRWLRHTIAAFMTLALLGCTDSEPIDDNSTTVDTMPPTTRPTFDMSNFSMDQVADGPPLDWSRAISDDSLRPIGLEQLGGTTFVFAEDVSRHGLRGWSSTDGVTWNDLGPIVSEGQEVAVVTSSEDAILFVTEGSAGHNPEIWHSGNGLDWSVEEIPTDPENDLLAFSPHALLATSGLQIVAGVWTTDAGEVLQNAVSETFWTGFESSRYGFEIRPARDAIQIDVLGPAHLTMLTTTAEELGLDSTTQEWLRAEPERLGVEAWSSFDGSDWTPSTIEGAATISSVATTTIGDVIAGGSTQLGIWSLWESFDGILWDQISYDVRPYLFEEWGDRLIGPSAVGDFDLLVSDDGVEWAETGLGIRFPRALVWHIRSSSASDRGYVATAEAFDSEGRVGGGSEIPPIEKGDLEIWLDPFSGSLAVFEGDDSYSWAAGPYDESLIFDPATEIIRLLRPDGSDLVELTLDELDTAVKATEANFGRFGSYYRGLLFTTDADSWTVWNLAALGEDAEPDNVGVVGSTLVVVTQNHLTGAGFDLWTAPLP